MEKIQIEKKWGTKEIKLKIKLFFMELASQMMYFWGGNPLFVSGDTFKNVSC